jgi:ferredoxin
MKIFYFTGTGNCLHIARDISAGAELISIPRFLRENKDETGRIKVKAESIGLVFPTYWLAVPAIIVEFLERVSFDTRYLFAVTTRGNISLTLKSHLLQVMRKNGHSLSYFYKVTMPDNYLPLCDMAKERQRFDKEKLDRSIKSISSDISRHRRNISGLAGLNIMRPLVLNYPSSQMKNFTRRIFIDSSCGACGACGTCVQVCSAQSIKLVDGIPVYSSTCNYCLACVHNCPQGAIHMDPEKSSERYLNPTVSLDDIISASG